MYRLGAISKRALCNSTWSKKRNISDKPIGSNLTIRVVINIENHLLNCSQLTKNPIASSDRSPRSVCFLTYLPKSMPNRDGIKNASGSYYRQLAFAL